VKKFNLVQQNAIKSGKMIFLVRQNYSPTKCIFSPTKFNLVRQNARKSDEMQFSPTKNNFFQHFHFSLTFLVQKKL
jgi:hypothetical protein